MLFFPFNKVKISFYFSLIIRMQQAQNYVSVVFLGRKTNRMCPVLHGSTQFATSFDELKQIAAQNSSNRMAICIHDREFSMNIADVISQLPNVVLLVFCKRHSDFGVDCIYSKMIDYTVDLCSNGEWECMVHTALANQCRERRYLDQARTEFGIAELIKKRRRK